MHELVLHHYPGSPLAEKVRLMLGFKQLSWRSVVMPSLLPGPDLIALTGGYRGSPVLQVGADIYCDTALIARRLEAEKTTPPLYPEGWEFVVAGFAAWADRELSRHALGLADGRGLPALQARQQWPILMARLQEQLERTSGDFLFGEASLADFAVAHSLWLLHSVPATAGLVDAYPAASAWLERVSGFGHGSHSELSVQEAVDIAQGAVPALLPEAVAIPEGIEPGQWVAVVTSDEDCSPVQGELLHAGAETLILRIEAPQAGTLHLHLPRLGMRVEAL